MGVDNEKTEEVVKLCDVSEVIGREVAMDSDYCGANTVYWVLPEINQFYIWEHRRKFRDVKCGDVATAQVHRSHIHSTASVSWNCFQILTRTILIDWYLLKLHILTQTGKAP